MPCRCARLSGRRRGRTLPALALVVALAALAPAGCAESVTTLRAVDAHGLHGRSVLMLQPSRTPGTDPALHEQVVNELEAAISGSPEVGRVITREAFRNRSGLSLTLRTDYERFSNALALTGVPSPELSHRLGQALGVELLALAQPMLLPCAVCDSGDELWVVGQVVEAETGRLLFRSHAHRPVERDEPDLLAAHARALADRLLESFSDAFRLKWHRQRFEHLKPDAAS